MASERGLWAELRAAQLDRALEALIPLTGAPTNATTSAELRQAREDLILDELARIGRWDQ